MICLLISAGKGPAECRMAAHGELAQAGERGLVHAEHDQLERGRPVRRYAGMGWTEG